MSMNPVSEEALRASLSPFRVDPAAFEVGVLSRVAVAARQPGIAPLAGLSPFLKSVAALLPLGFLTGCQVAPAPAKLTPAAIGSKLLSYLAFPAISLFALLAAAVFSVFKIRSLQPQNGDAIPGQSELANALQKWVSDHKWGAAGVFSVSLALAISGSSELLFWFYIASFGVLIYVISAFAKSGLGNRYWVGGLCMQGLALLGQAAASGMIGAAEIHLLDQTLVMAVFFGGALALAAVICFFTPAIAMPPHQATQKIVGAMFAIIVIPLLLWTVRPDLWLNPPLRIKSEVESFDHARFSSANWNQWEIPARWAMDSHLEPDLSKPRQLAASEVAGAQNRFVLSSAMRCELLSVDQTHLLNEYDNMQRSLVSSTPGIKPDGISSLPQYDWVVRTAALRGDLTPAERNVLEQRLHATLDDLPNESYVGLDDLLSATQLLKVLGRPVQPEQYREKIHQLLREFHTTGSGGFAVAGGFKRSRTLPIGFPGDLVATSQAVQLMEIYGVPDGLDLLWVRSFLKPSVYRYTKAEWMIATVTLDRLNHLPGVDPPTWLDYLYYERTILAAAVLVGLCLYATILSPNPKINREAEDAPVPEPTETVVEQ